MNNSNPNAQAFRNLDSLLISLAGFILILIYTNHSGIGISPDSIVYLSVAKNINTQGLLLDYDLRPLVDFPVFYPAFLSVIGFFSKSNLIGVAPYLNGALFAGIIFLSGYLISKFEDVSLLYKRILLISIAFSPALFDVYGMLWSETLFIFLSLLFILTFSIYLRTRTISKLIFCALIAGIACITRYAGITIIASGLMLLFFEPSVKWDRKIKPLLIFGGLSIIPLVINLIHNRLVAGLMTGPRESGITSLKVNIYYYGSVVCDWAGITTVQPLLISSIALLIFLAITGLFLNRIATGKNYTGTENCFTALFIVYTVFIIGISTLSHFEQINNRLLSPSFLPFLISSTAWIPAVLRKLDKKQLYISLCVLFIIAANFGYNRFNRLNNMYTEAKTYGIAGYTDDSWKNSEISKYLRTHSADFDKQYSLYSNAHEAAWFNGKTRSESLPHLIDKKDVKSFFGKKGHYLIWFNAIDDDELIGLQLIRKHADVVVINNFKDGTIYMVTPHHH